MTHLESLTLLDMSDREFLLAVRDAGGLAPGFVTSTEVATHLNLGGENPSRSVSSRMSWLKRWGAVEREYERDSNGNIKEHERSGKPITKQGWQLTDLGLQMAIGKLSKAQQKSLENLKEGQMLMMTRWLSQRVAGSDGSVGKLMDREYRYGVGRR